MGVSLVTLCVVSPDKATGKTAICAGLGGYLQAAGRKVGFFKPTMDGTSDGDAAFMRQVLSLPEAVESMCPPIEDGKAPKDKVQKAHAEISRGKDVVLVEAALGSTPEDKLSKSSYDIARVLNARVLAITAYSGQSITPELYQGFGKNLLGMVINKVPKSQLKRVRDEVSGSGIKVMGVLPEDRALLALTVAELADSINGEIFDSAEKADELVENFMLGAMVVDSGLDYFGRKDNKAVIIRGDRPDMQLAALETATKCLVLSSSAGPPVISVQEKAENRGVPIIIAESNADSIVASIEDALGKARLSQAKKLPILAEIMQQHLDLPALSKGLGLTG